MKLPILSSKKYLAWETITHKFNEAPVPSGPFKGRRLDKENLKIMADDYYDSYGWDKKPMRP